MSGSASPAGRRTVLVVDDDGQARRSLDQLLAANGYAVLTAADGGEALRLLRQRGNEIGLALVDVLMPGADGPAVLAALRQLRPGLPACFLSSVGCGYTEAELLARGAAAVLDKPLQQGAVLAVVGGLLP